MVSDAPGAVMTKGEQGPAPRITLYTKTDCELCDAAKATLLTLQRELDFELDEIDITTDPALYDAFHLEIPVGYLQRHAGPGAHLSRGVDSSILSCRIGWFYRG